jgi:putative transferase (TIGR04331 family)
MKKNLVTTALKDTWPSSQEKLVFLGEWCKLYNDKKNWHQKKNETLEYHWDDREKFFQDFHYLQSFYEKVLIQLSQKLNEIHDLNNSIQYWRIIIGPWLCNFIHVFFDRWEMIKLAKNNNVLSTNILKMDSKDFTPESLSNYIENLSFDEWNHYIYSKILVEQKFNIKIINKKIKKKIKKNIRFSLSKIFKHFLKMLSFITINEKYVLYKTYLPKFKHFLLEIKLFQFPKLRTFEEETPSIYDRDIRNFKLNFHCSNEFEKALIKELNHQIPMSYLETFPKNRVSTKLKKINAVPKVIFTSNSHLRNDIFNIYMAECSLLGTKIVLGQHGGHMGIGLFDIEADHENLISDYYLSWCKISEPNSGKISVGQLIDTKLNLNLNYKTNNRILLVNTSVSRYANRPFSFIVSSQWQKHLDFQFSLVNHLKNNIKNRLFIRVDDSVDFKLYERSRWQDKFINIKFDGIKNSLVQSANKSRLVICTYNGTTFHETFLMDVPTILYWDEKYFELKPTIKPIFEKLKKAKVFFNDPVKASDHINKIWDNIEIWWESKEVKSAINEFTKNYSYKNHNLVNKICNVIKNA